jgi:hypothetical protein
MAGSRYTHINGMAERKRQLTVKNSSESYIREESMLAIRKVQQRACVLDSNRLRADTVLQLVQR